MHFKLPQVSGLYGSSYSWSMCNSIQNIQSLIWAEYPSYKHLVDSSDFWQLFFPQPQAPQVFAGGSFVNPLRKDQIQQRKEEVGAACFLKLLQTAPPRKAQYEIFTDQQLSWVNQTPKPSFLVPSKNKKKLKLSWSPLQLVSITWIFEGLLPSVHQRGIFSSSVCCCSYTKLG